jgi:DNA-binding transcriptional MerR regulator
MSTTAHTSRAKGPPQPSGQRLLTIGAVCRRLEPEFADISISKIRYLEDQGLLAPRRTQGGYRLFSEEDVERLQTILRLQRDEFLPLRVIRQELASPSANERRRRRPVGLTGEEDEITTAELCERAGITPGMAKELADYGLLEARVEAGERLYGESDVEVAIACARLATYGVSGRHLRAFRTTADRQAGLLEQLLAPALRARSPERRAAAVEDLQSLAESAQELAQLLFWRDLRQVVSR